MLVEEGMLTQSIGSLCILYHGTSRMNRYALHCKVEVSYLEIEEECVWDLLNADHRLGDSLKVREHPDKGKRSGATSCRPDLSYSSLTYTTFSGTYVQELSHHVVREYHELQSLVNAGDKARLVRVGFALR